MGSLTVLTKELRRGALLGTIVTGSLLLAACSSGGSSSSPPLRNGTLVPTPTTAAATITMAEYNQVANGMSYAQVSQIFGGPGHSIFDSNSSGGGFNFHTQDFRWSAGNGGSATMVFQNDAVISKNEVNLK